MDSRYKKYMIEARHEDGSLNVKDNTCPFLIATEDQLFKYYFSKVPDTRSASWGELREYFKSNGWYIRETTW